VEQLCIFICVNWNQLYSLNLDNIASGRADNVSILIGRALFDDALAREEVPAGHFAVQPAVAAGPIEMACQSNLHHVVLLVNGRVGG
jgi:hypothetical protein